ncbi:MAG: FkbM family methyltransferase [Dehalococcoidia bacterium]
MASLPNPIRTQGLTIYWDRQGPVIIPELAAGSYESDTRLLVGNSLGPGMTMLDLGAHVGYFSLIAARCVGSSGRVFAFEPQPRVYDVLVKNIKANGFHSTIRPVRKAVSNATGAAALLLAREGSGGASFYPIPGASSLEKVVVETTTLDAFLAAEGWPRVHLMKMDIEGAEKVALEGMRELAKRNLTLKLIVEFAPLVQAAAGVTPEELFETLLALGFRKFWVIVRGLQPLSIPQDIPRLVRMAGMAENLYVNLLCER